jgi:hypothetical protein
MALGRIRCHRGLFWAGSPPGLAGERGLGGQALPLGLGYQVALPFACELGGEGGVRNHGSLLSARMWGR